MDWKECIDKKMVKELSIDTELIESLKISADKRFESASRLEIDEITAATVFSLQYDCLRELLEAVALKNRFKIYNHDCYCAFLKEVLGNSQLGEKFDRFRKIRNGINYYGKDLDIETAKELSKEIIELIDTIKNVLR
jgi:hypothetical protein